jgi:hypothetical protein
MNSQANLKLEKGQLSDEMDTFNVRTSGCLRKREVHKQN